MKRIFVEMSTKWKGPLMGMLNKFMKNFLDLKIINKIFKRLSIPVKS